MRRPPRRPLLGLFLLLLAGLALRAGRLGWQPLWWDEGYSVYFATEPPARMLWLTARDIHPPLYYALLHSWFALAGFTGPEVARALSIVCGAAALPVLWVLARLMVPARPAVAIVAAALLAVNPFHLFYSQEVRMYGLALLLALAATTFFWLLVRRLDAGEPAALPALAYVVAAGLSLQTLYYTGFLLAAHQLWAWVYFRRRPAALIWVAGSGLAVLLLQLPWWVYALPQLIPYVADKVVADRDLPLPLGTYLLRHGVAFFGGSVAAPWPWLDLLRYAGLLGLIALPFAFRPAAHVGSNPAAPSSRAAVAALAAFTLVPVALAFAVNRRLPFFPEGGERLLLFVLPLLLLWLAWGMVAAWEWRQTAVLLMLPMLLAAGVGVAAFYTVPRYTEGDYRPIVRFVTQHSRPADTVFAIFPWQVGYWRAYGVRDQQGGWLAPQPAPLDQQALVWNDSLRRQLEDGLARGTVWFPAPLSLGSSLPQEVESFLASQARNLENRWFSPETRLSGWVALPEPAPVRVSALTFGPVSLAAAAVTTKPVAAANSPLAIDLAWTQLPAEGLHLTLRLEDEEARTWARRDYEPLGLFAASVPAQGLAAGPEERLAFLVPAGLPPGRYTLKAGVGPQGAETLYPVETSTGTAVPLAALAALTVTTPQARVDPARLPIAFDLPTSTAGGITLLGQSGVSPQSRWLAGTEIPVTLFVQSGREAPPVGSLRLSLLARRGREVAAWEGWPLPGYPPATWTAGALVQLPAGLQLPADLAAGAYTLAIRFGAGDAAVEGQPAALAAVEITRRPAGFTPLTPAIRLDPPIQFGTHVELLGYTLHVDGDTVGLELDWHVLQPILPPHQIFVHLTAADGAPLAQADDPPQTEAGPAPTGSWLPGEYLRTVHHLALPDGLPADQEVTLQAGLYIPSTGVRLPASQGGAARGDAALLPLP